MDRLACVDVRALPLQLALRAEPAWRERPAAVLDRDASGGRVLWLDEKARARGVLPGMTHAAALALATDLVARAVPAHEVERGTRELRELIERFSPEVEPCADDPGIFWVDVGGLELFHPTVDAWAAALHAALAERGFASAIAVGFRREAVFAAARALGRARIRIAPTPERELAELAAVELARLDFEPEARDALDALGVRTLGELARLPANGLELRFGGEVSRWQRIATGLFAGEFAPSTLAEPERALADFEHALASSDALLAAFEELAAPVFARLAARERAVKSLAVTLELDGAAPKRIELSTAAPTHALAEFRRLLALRLERVTLARGVERLALEFRDVAARPDELALFAERPKRDLAAASRALAALRAAFGPSAVVVARLVERHLPEASFEWVPLERAAAPRPRAVERARLVRRVFDAPQPLPPRDRHADDGWLLAGSLRGPVKKLSGPYPLCGGWWKHEVRRDYYFAELACGEWLWVYYDQARRRWFWQGTVA
jgi:protein ImuB